MSKVVEKLIHHCRDEDIIPPEQTSFMSGVVSEHQLAKLQAQTINLINRNRETALILNQREPRHSIVYLTSFWYAV